MKADVTYSNGYIWLRPEGQPLSQWKWDQLRAMNRDVRQGGCWIRAHKSYRYPATMQVCHELRRVWGDGLRLTDEVRDWFRQQKQAEAAQAARSMQADAQLARLPQVAPKLAATLRPDQRAGVAWFAAGYRDGGILADQPGVGKTLEAIGGVLESGITGPILVTCPRLAVKRVWQREFRTWTDVPVFIARGTRASRERALRRFFACEEETKVLVCVAEMLRVQRTTQGAESRALRKKRGAVEGFSFPQLFDTTALGGGWAWILADESHKLLGSLSVVKSNLAGEGLALLPVRPGGQRRAITGTPFGKGGRVQGMFGTLHWMWKDEYRSFWVWADKYFEVHEEEVYIRGGRGAKKGVRKLGDMKLTEEELMADLGARILRRTKAEVLPHLPPKTYIKLPCEMKPDQVRQYKALFDNAEVLTANGPITANSALALRTRSKQIACGVIDKDEDDNVFFTGVSGKLDMFYEMMDARGILDNPLQEHPDDVKVVVSSEYNELLFALCASLDHDKIPYLLVTGATSDAARDRAMDEFQAFGGPRIFVLNAKAGGISVTLDAADEIHKLGYLDDPGDEEQLEDRIHRASNTTHKVRVYLYESEGTIDERIGYDVEGKRWYQWKVLDGRRGLQYVRDLVTYRAPEED